MPLINKKEHLVNIGLQNTAASNYFTQSHNKQVFWIKDKGGLYSATDTLQTFWNSRETRWKSGSRIRKPSSRPQCTRASKGRRSTRSSQRTSARLHRSSAAAAPAAPAVPPAAPAAAPRLADTTAPTAQQQAQQQASSRRHSLMQHPATAATGPVLLSPPPSMPRLALANAPPRRPALQQHAPAHCAHRPSPATLARSRPHTRPSSHVPSLPPA